MFKFLMFYLFQMKCFPMLFSDVRQKPSFIYETLNKRCVLKIQVSGLLYVFCNYKKILNINPEIENLFPPPLSPFPFFKGSGYMAPRFLSMCLTKMVHV
jgi:hypothetical protein